MLQSHSTDNYGNKRYDCIWGASFVEASPKSYLELWEQRNKYAHSPEAHIHLTKEQEAKTTRKSYKHRHHAQSWDSALFLLNIEQFIETYTAQKLQRYILMNSKEIRQSVRCARKPLLNTQNLSSIGSVQSENKPVQYCNNIREII